jgi:DNA-binding MarR family transcriptional regulator
MSPLHPIYLANLWNNSGMTTSTAGRGAAGSDATAAQHESRLGEDLLNVVARLNRMATQRIQMPLPAAQARLLSTIENYGEARICDLAAVDHCSQPTMTTQVRRLEEAGLVTRTVDPGDGRAVRIRITPQGNRVLAQVRADRAAAIEPQLDRLGPADRDVLADAVTVLRRLLDDSTALPRQSLANRTS